MRKSKQILNCVKNHFFAGLVLIMSIGGYSCRDQKKENPVNEDTLFKLLSPDSTGVVFSNDLKEGLNTNVLKYEYFYNGGGVSIADLNGDGLQDLYFTANMADNKLFLNKGNMRFEDVTVAAGVVGRPGPWKTGVTVADVNGDGMRD